MEPEPEKTDTPGTCIHIAVPPEAARAPHPEGDESEDRSGQSPSPWNDLDGTLIAEGDSASSGRYESMEEEETTGDRPTESMVTANTSYHTARLGYPSPSSVYTSPEDRENPDMGQDTSDKWSDTASFHTPAPTSEDDSEEEEGDISVHIPDLGERTLQVGSNRGEEGGMELEGKGKGEEEEEEEGEDDRDGEGASGSVGGAREFVIDQPKLLLHEPPVEPCPQKQPLPPSHTGWSMPPPIVTGQTQREEHEGEEQVNETTPLLVKGGASAHGEGHKPPMDTGKRSGCDCCVII